MNPILPVGPVLAELSIFEVSVLPQALVTLVAKGFVITALAMVVDTVLQLCSTSAGRRHALWSVTLGALLLLPALSLVLPSWSVQVNSFGGGGAIARAPVGAAGPAEATLGPPEPEVPAAGTGTASPEPAGGPVEVEASWTARATTAVIGVWLLVSMALLVRSGVRWWRAGRLLQGATQWTEGPWARDLEVLRRRLGVSRRVRLVASRNAVMPATWGVVRPVIVVPEIARSWQPAQRRSVLLHELCHVRRMDWLTRGAGELACILHWFNPLVWYASWRLDEERERACDEEVVSCGVPAVEYARQLVDVARSLRFAASYRAMVALGLRSGLELRIRRILTAGAAAPPSRRSLVLTGFVALALILPLGSVQPWLSEATAASAQVREADEWSGERKVIWSQARTRFEAVFTADAEVSADASDLDRMEPGGVFDVVAKGAGEVRRLQITGAPSGSPQYRFWMNGREAPFEPAGREWLGTHLPRIVAETGFGARSHARHLRARGGLERVLDEAADLANARVQRLYLLEPVRQGLASSDLDILVERSTHILSGSGDLGRFLYAVAPVYLSLPATRAALLEASRSITSEDERARLLAALVEEQAGEDPEVVTDLIGAGVTVESDITRAGFLFSVSATVLDRPELHPAFFAALREIGSEDVLARMMGALLTREEPVLGSEVERTLFEAALAGIYSDTTKSGFLIHLRDRFLKDPSLRPAYLEAVATVREDRLRAELSEALRESGETLGPHPRP